MTAATRGARLTLLLGVLLVAAGLVAAQEPQLLDGADRAAIVEQISNALLETYVFPEDAEAMVRRLREQLAAGAYDGLDGVVTFCHQLTQDLHEVRRDLHLHVDPAPPPPPPPAQATDEEQARQLRQQQDRMRQMNYAFHTLEILEGNVGYLRLDGFVDTTDGGATAVAAMGFLANTDAIIFDLRYNGGGAPSMIQLLSSYLFDEPTHLNSFYLRKGDTTQQFWTLPHIPGVRRPEVPVFVLTSGRTFSAAEEFTYNLKHLERATIVGETTLGGAHPVKHLTVAGYPIAMSLPFGRAINPVTGTNWEGTGVEPHIKVPASEALDTAHLQALELIHEATDDPLRRHDLEVSRDLVKARLDPIELDAAQLEACAGTFGPWSISVADGGLIMQRDQERFSLVAIGDDRFVPDGVEGACLSFERDESGAVVAVVGRYGGGREIRLPRQEEETTSLNAPGDWLPPTASITGVTKMAAHAFAYGRDAVQAVVLPDSKSSVNIG